MGLKIKKDDTGYRKFWYAVFTENGKKKEIKLDVPIQGTPPKSLHLKDSGDSKFEQSRGKAQKVFDDMMNSRRTKGATESLIASLIESKRGEKLEYHRLTDLPALWNGMARASDISEGRQRFNELVFKEFKDFCHRTYLYEVTDADAKSYFFDIRGRFSWETVKSRISLLSGAFSRFLPSGSSNPFKKLVKRSKVGENETISKIPLTTAQLASVIEVAKEDPFLYPLVVCAISTGARIKDVCNMKWENIDLADGFVTYVSAKTGKRCEVPLFDEFREVCEGLLATKEPGEEFLFPEAAAMYEHNRHGVEYRGKRLFLNALFPEKERKEVIEVIDGVSTDPLTPIEVLELLDKQDYSAKKNVRIKAVYCAYVIDKKSIRAIEQELGIPRTTASDYLKEISSLPRVGKVSRYTENPGNSIKARLKQTRKERKIGKLSASIYGWHTFRSTFCVLADLKGVPHKEIINAVGHSTYDTTLRYYNNPTREHVKEVWRNKVGKSILGTPSSTPQPSQLNIIKLINSLSPTQQATILNQIEILQRG